MCSGPSQINPKASKIRETGFMLSDFDLPGFRSKLCHGHP